MPLTIRNLTHIYAPGTPFEQNAIVDVSLTVNDGDFAAIIGHTGSGKSTLIQHFNALIKPTGGQVFVNDIDVTSKDTDLKTVRRSIGLVFQYPEYQLFEETVYKDIAFGPKNLKLSDEEIDERVRRACELVHLDFEAFKDKSPFELSGGQKRRVAIAGVLAMDPGILVLDEPAAGLDPAGREEILSLVSQWHKTGKTIVMVSHSMDDVARFANRVFVMNEGKLVLQGSPEEVFSHEQELESFGLGIPQAQKLANDLRAAGFALEDNIFTIDALEKALLAALQRGEGKPCRT